MKKKWALFFSGRGSNLKAVLDQYSMTWTHRPILITDNATSNGIEIAKSFGLDTLVLEKPIDYNKLSEFLKTNETQLIFLLGYLKIIPSSFISVWENNIFNLHPSLLPSYPGLKSIRRAFQDKSAIGVTIHRVSEGVDQGEILVQDEVLKESSYDHLSLEEVEGMVHSREHKLVCDFILKGETQFGSKI